MPLLMEEMDVGGQMIERLIDDWPTLDRGRHLRAALIIKHKKVECR